MENIENTQIVENIENNVENIENNVENIETKSPEQVRYEKKISDLQEENKKLKDDIFNLKVDLKSLMLNTDISKKEEYGFYKQFME